MLHETTMADLEEVKMGIEHLMEGQRKMENALTIVQTTMQQIVETQKLQADHDRRIALVELALTHINGTLKQFSDGYEGKILALKTEHNAELEKIRKSQEDGFRDISSDRKEENEKREKRFQWAVGIAASFIGALILFWLARIYGK